MLRLVAFLDVYNSVYGLCTDKPFTPSAAGNAERVPADTAGTDALVRMLH